MVPSESRHPFEGQDLDFLSLSDEEAARDQKMAAKLNGGKRRSRGEVSFTASHSTAVGSGGSQNMRSRRSSRASLLDSASASVDGLDLLGTEASYGRRGPRPSLHRMDSIRSVCCEPSHTEADWNVLRIRNPYLNLVSRRNAFSVASAQSFEKFSDGSQGEAPNSGSLTSMLSGSFTRLRLSSKSKKSPLARLGLSRKSSPAHSQCEETSSKAAVFSKGAVRPDSYRSTFSEISGLSMDGGLIYGSGLVCGDSGSNHDITQLSPSSLSSADSGYAGARHQFLDNDEPTNVTARQYIRVGIYSNMVSHMAKIKAR